MGEVYGNVNVKYSYCKSIAQLKSAADYILGRRKEQIQDGVVKTEKGLYTALGCNRDNFANSIIITRKLHQKKYSRYQQKEILAQKLSISFHPDDNYKVTYEEAYEIAKEFATKFFWNKGYEVLFAVHTDTEHIHVHFLVSNCNVKDGKSFRRGTKELVEMSKFFGNQCQERGYESSIRDTFYNPEKTRDEIGFREYQMKKREKLTFKEEIKIYIRLAMNDSETKTLGDVIDKLKTIYKIDVRLRGNTISYALPYYRNKGGKPRRVRGSKLGKRFTVAGIEQYMQEKERRELEYKRLNQDIEESHSYINDYDDWKEKVEVTDKKEDEDISIYEAFDRFQEEKEVSENDEEIFYGGVFHDFNQRWQGAENSSVREKEEDKSIRTEKKEDSSIDFKKLLLEERVKLLPPPSEDMLEELERYERRMGYDEETMRKLKYKMSVYGDFLEEYEYRKLYHGIKENEIVKEEKEHSR